MPIYQRKLFKAQQWNKVGDVPAFAFGKVQESSDGFLLTGKDKITTGYPGDYICQRPDGSAIYVCSQQTFEACNILVEDSIADTFFDKVAAIRKERLDHGFNFMEEASLTIERLREIFMENVARGNMAKAAYYGMVIDSRESLKGEIWGKIAYDRFKELKSN